MTYEFKFTTAGSIWDNICIRLTALNEWECVIRQSKTSKQQGKLDNKTYAQILQLILCHLKLMN